jgi:hypothetical protein
VPNSTSNNKLLECPTSPATRNPLLGSSGVDKASDTLYRESPANEPANEKLTPNANIYRQENRPSRRHTISCSQAQRLLVQRTYKRNTSYKSKGESNIHTVNELKCFCNDLRLQRTLFHFSLTRNSPIPKGCSSNSHAFTGSTNEGRLLVSGMFPTLVIPRSSKLTIE